MQFLAMLSAKHQKDRRGGTLSRLQILPKQSGKILWGTASVPFPTRKRNQIYRSGSFKSQSSRVMAMALSMSQSTTVPRM